MVDQASDILEPVDDDLHGYYLEDLSVGMTAALTNTVQESDIMLFAKVTGDSNPIHLDEDYASKTMFGGRIAHGMLTAGYISAVLGTKLPGPGAIYISQSLRFKAPVRIGDTVVATVTIGAIDNKRRRVSLQTKCSVGETVVLEGEAMLMVARRDTA
ncbi:MAG: MaoC family dehydratase [Alphaproteobacteria bacterium]